MLFMPTEETRAERLLERCLLSHDFEVLWWRDVPVCTEWLGEMALGTMPRIRQVLVVDSGNAEPGTMERRLYLARKQFERAHAQGDVTGYVCSLSSQTIVYKAMCTGEFLAELFSGSGVGRLRHSVRGFSSDDMRRTLCRHGIARSREESSDTTARSIRCGEIVRVWRRGTRRCRWSASRS